MQDIRANLYKSRFIYCITMNFLELTLIIFLTTQTFPGKTDTIIENEQNYDSERAEFKSAEHMDTQNQQFGQLDNRNFQQSNNQNFQQSNSQNFQQSDNQQFGQLDNRNFQQPNNQNFQQSDNQNFQQSDNQHFGQSDNPNFQQPNDQNSDYQNTELKSAEDAFDVPYGYYGTGPNPDEEGDFFEGDIDFEGDEDEFLDVYSETRNVIKNNTRKWPNATVPFFIDADKFTYSQVELIRLAMADFHRLTCIRFIPRTTELLYVNITSLKGCSSHVGRKLNDSQHVSLQVPRCVRRGVILHELMHALGIWHEHARPDRDQFIKINWNNIKPNMKGNFRKLSHSVAQVFNTSYDFSSVMHYSPYGFAVNKRTPTIISTQGSDMSVNRIGQRYGFSPTDLQKINILYGCHEANHELSNG